ncbi:MULTISPECIES: PASTA domain-containing protein [unclassified Frankia]|uniref:PASTA domain-containing protein n=1 Tax=unclassified Frankia TaxID=2632575 RepID=UPI0006CA0BBE|nr:MULTISPECIES: PASTA domain-containing protein [unclassified Frankia]
MPNVVGLDHQLAQDTLQAAGFYYLAEEDATGQGRALILDRNWQVVSQEPAAGTVIGTDHKVLLRSKKDTDP